MKVLHVPYCYYPDAVGGAEAYVSALAALGTARYESVVAAPAPSAATYDHDGVKVWRFVVSPDPALLEIYGSGDPLAAAGFSDILNEERPDIVHVHSYTPAASLLLVRAAHHVGAAVVYTCHHPATTCPRGTLLLRGHDVCDGTVRVRRCTACLAQGAGAPDAVAQLVGVVPQVLGRAVARSDLTGRLATAMSMTHLLDARRQTLASFMREVDAVVVIADWTRQVLNRNGVAPEKIHISRQGYAGPTAPSGGDCSVREPGPPRLAFLGRADPAKGLEMLLEAVRGVPALDVIIDVYAITQGMETQQYLESLQRRYAGLSQVRFLEPLAPAEIPLRLQQYDAVAVPSVSVETAPLVVLDAFAAGVPVIGSRRGGIAEMVRDGVDGLLVDVSVGAWSKALLALCANASLLATLRAGVRAPRSMVSVAEDMDGLYRQLVPADRRVAGGGKGARS